VGAALIQADRRTEGRIGRDRLRQTDMLKQIRASFYEQRKEREKESNRKRQKQPERRKD
jgi:hypothetical protein